MVVGTQNDEAQVALGRDAATAVAVAAAGGADLTARAFARAMRRALRTRRLPLEITTPEATRIRVRLALGRRTLDVRTFRISDDGGGTTTVRLDAADRIAIARARRGSGRARLALIVTATDRSGNEAQSRVDAVLP